MRLILAALVALPAADRSRPFVPAEHVVTQAVSVRPPTVAAVDTGVSFLADIELGARLVGRGLTAPLQWTTREWLTLPAAAAVLVPVSGLDDGVQSFALGHRGTIRDRYFEALEPFGEAYSFGVVVGLYAGGLVLARPRLRRIAVEGAAASVVAAGIVTPVLKLAVGRSRPREGMGPYRFAPFSGEMSFPSGHTTQAFAVASVIAAESELLAVDLLAYGVAASVGVARIYHDAHFLTDVLAGGAIGTVVGRGMVRGGRDAAVQIHPFLDVLESGAPALGIAFRYHPRRVR